MQHRFSWRQPSRWVVFQQRADERDQSGITNVKRLSDPFQARLVRDGFGVINHRVELPQSAILEQMDRDGPQEVLHLFQ